MTDTQLETTWQEAKPQIQGELSTLDKMYWTFVVLRLTATIAIVILIYPYIEDLLDSLEWYLCVITIIGIGSLIWAPINFITSIFTDNKYKGKVLRTLIGIVLPGARHSEKSALTPDDISRSRILILDKLHYLETQDYICGSVGVNEFDFTEILVKDAEKHFDEDLIGTFEHYKGFFMRVKLPNAIDGCTLISTDKETITNALESTDMTPFSADTLNGKFHACTTNPTEAARLLTAAFATRLSESLSLYESICHYTQISLSFQGSNMYIMSDNDTDFFEACESLAEAKKDFVMLHLIKQFATLL